MKVGVQCYFSGPSAMAEAITDAARTAEEIGLHSFWLGEHVVLFDEYASTYPYTQDGRYPVESVDGVPLDPFVGLSVAAAVTRRIRLGTGVLLIPQRNPVYTAKYVRDLDAVSGGRFDFGVGVGWLKEEFDALTVPFEHRGARADEYLELMKTLWREREASFEGRFYTLKNAVQGPRTVQTPHPPIIVGGESDAAIRRAARNEGWYTVDRSPEDLKPALAKLDDCLAEAGKRREDIQIIVNPFHQPADSDALKRYRDLGVDQVLVLRSRWTRKRRRTKSPGSPTPWSGPPRTCERAGII